MGQYEAVLFRAVDAPLDDRQLAFANRQSSRADVTRRSLSVEYHHSSFRGNVGALLRNGFDLYLRETSYGIRELRLRFPHGLPFASGLREKYLDGDRLSWSKDPRGSGGILTLCPFRESGDFESLVDLADYVDAAIEARERLMSGDLRPLYVFWLCGAFDDNELPEELIEPPVPFGLSEAASYAGPLLDFYDLDPLLLTAAAQDSPPVPVDETTAPAELWVESLDLKTAKQWLRSFLTDDPVRVRADALERLRTASPADAWPTVDCGRTFETLQAITKKLRDEAKAKQAREAAARRAKTQGEAKRKRLERLRTMTDDPDRWLRKATELVEGRGSDNYDKAAKLLRDLRDAIGTAAGNRKIRRFVDKLLGQYPTLTKLKGALRKRGLVE